MHRPKGTPNQHQQAIQKMLAVIGPCWPGFSIENFCFLFRFRRCPALNCINRKMENSMSEPNNDIASVANKILRREGTPNPDAIGRVQLHVLDFQSKSNPKNVNVDLYNYGIDGNELRHEHKQWLQSQLVPFVRHYRYHVKILGRASSSGPSWANKRVSRERVLLLKEFLTIQCGLSEAQVPGNELREQSSNFAVHDTEDQFDRSVRIVLSPGWKTRPDPVALMKVRVGRDPNLLPTGNVTLDDIVNNWPKHDSVSVPYGKPRKKYQIRYLGGFGAAFMLGGSFHRFEIRDESGGVKRFKMKAANIDIGAYYNPTPTRVIWSDFTSNAQDLSSFDGRWAQLGSVGAMMNSKTGIAILGADRVELDTGFGLSAGRVPVNASAGSLQSD
jgi:hypothetical protein